MFTSGGVVDVDTGEVQGDLSKSLLVPPGGILAGTNMYPKLAPLAETLGRDHGWSMRMVEPKKRKINTDRLHGSLQWWRLTYRHPKIRDDGKRYRPGSIRWTVINLESWREVDESEFIPALTSLLDLAKSRGITIRPSPGGFGAALMRASPEWTKDRRPAPWFISERARPHLPGNFYALRAGYKLKRIPNAYYLDQISSHHTIAATVDLPDPCDLRARGKDRMVGRTGEFRRWIQGHNLDKMSHHIGVLMCVVECDHIPETQRHLYPPWALKKGTSNAWIWTPELRLLGRRTRIRWVSAAFTAERPDPVLREYGLWALSQRASAKHPIVKNALLPAYGMLASRVHDIESYVVSGRDTPPRAQRVQLPLVPSGADRTLVKNSRRPALQNVVARGVLEAETRVRSIEYARELEEHGIHVSQIYADGLIAATDRLPLVPPTWRIVAALTNVCAPSPNSILANEMIRLPGIPGGRRTVRIEQTSSVG